MSRKPCSRKSYILQQNFEVHKFCSVAANLILLLSIGKIHFFGQKSRLSTFFGLTVHSDTHGIDRSCGEFGEYHEMPSKPRILEKLSIASIAPTSELGFGDEHMIKAQHGLLARQSLDDSCLVGTGEDISSSCMPFVYFSSYKLN